MKKVLTVLALFACLACLGCAQINKAACWVDKLYEPCEVVPADDESK